MKENQKKYKIVHKVATKEQYFLRIFRILKNDMLFSQISSLKHEKKLHFKGEIHVIHDYM